MPTKKVDLCSLPEEQRRQVERALYPRKTALALKFNAVHIEAWKKAAKRAKKSLTAWIEEKLNT